MLTRMRSTSRDIKPAPVDWSMSMNNEVSGMTMTRISRIVKVKRGVHLE